MTDHYKSLLLGDVIEEGDEYWEMAEVLEENNNG